MDPTLRGAEDYDLWLRIAHVTQDHYIPEVLVHVREHVGRTTKDANFLPAVCRAFELQIYRWAFLDEELRHGFRRLTASQYGHLSYAERERGCFKGAYHALKQAMRYADRPWRLWPRAIALRWFPWVFRVYDAYRQSGVRKQ